MKSTAPRTIDKHFIPVTQDRITEKIRPLHVFVIILVGLILTLPAIVYGLPDITSDSASHALWYTHFSEQLWRGELYPRWLLSMNEGLGSPVFFYYPPLAYYLTSILHPLFTNDQGGWHQLGVSASLALVASGFCAYLWLKRITNQNSALVAAILYMAMPYHLGFDLYSRGAFAEYWGYVWMPLVLYFANGITRIHKLAFVGLAVSYALLIMTHLPTTLIFSAIPVFYAFFMADRRNRVKVLGLTLCAMILGAGLAAIYLLPAMTTQDFVFIRAARPNYEEYFLFSNLRLWGDSTASLSWLALNTLGLACCAFIISRSSASSLVKKESAFWLIAVVVYVFMMTPLSKPVWQTISVLQAIQFPFRFNTVIAVVTAAFLALGIYSIKKPYTTLTRTALLIASLLVISWVFPTAMIARNSFSAFKPKQEALKRKNQIRARGTKEHYEYWPRWADPEIELETLLYRDGSGNPVKANIIEGTGSVVVNSWEPRNIMLQVDAQSDVLLYISQFYYPGWTAQLIDESSYLVVQPSEPEGLLRISVPGGNHQVLLHLAQRNQERAGQIISAISAVVTLLLAIWFFTARRRLNKLE